jgi:hypothetical protein
VADTPFVYDASPTTADTVVTLQELSSLMSTGGKGFVKDPRKVMHFVRRVGITVQASLEQSRGMRRMIEQLQLDREHAGTPTTLSPSDAAKFMPSEELARVVGGRVADELEAAVRIRKEADTTRRAARAELNQVRYVVSTMLESPGISPDTRDTFKHLLAELASKWPVDEDDSGGGANASVTGDAPVIAPEAVASTRAEISTQTPADALGMADAVVDTGDQVQTVSHTDDADAIPSGGVSGQGDDGADRPAIPAADVTLLGPPAPTASPLVDAPPADISRQGPATAGEPVHVTDAVGLGEAEPEAEPDAAIDGAENAEPDRNGEDGARGGLESVFG